MWSREYLAFRFLSIWLSGPPQAFIKKLIEFYEGDKWQARSHLNQPKGWGGKSNYNPLPIIQLKKIWTQPGPPPFFNFIFLKGCLSLRFPGYICPFYLVVRSRRKNTLQYLVTAKRKKILSILVVDGSRRWQDYRWWDLCFLKRGRIYIFSTWSFFKSFLVHKKTVLKCFLLRREKNGKIQNSFFSPPPKKRLVDLYIATI